MTEINQLPDHWHVFDNAQTLAQQLADTILQRADQAIQAKGAFHMVLAGGTSPLNAYRLLAKADAQWAHWHLYLGDERALPSDDPERNSVQIDQAWLSKVWVPRTQIHWMPTELGLDLSEKSYQKVLARFFETHDQFDQVLLGMGEDGHTASLFPGHPHPNQAWLVKETHAPKPPAQRLSMNACTLQRTACLMKLVSGQNKRDALKQWRAGVSLPINQVNPTPQAATNQQVWIDSHAL